MTVKIILAIAVVLLFLLVMAFLCIIWETMNNEID